MCRVQCLYVGFSLGIRMCVAGFVFTCYVLFFV